MTREDLARMHVRVALRTEVENTPFEKDDLSERREGEGDVDEDASGAERR